MVPATPEHAAIVPDIDENGVDRAQVRRMLDLSPEERLRAVEELVEAILEIRERNEGREGH
jgi:hypothetical protein